MRPTRSAQRVAIVVAGFGQNIVLTTVTTFILVYLLQYARISVRGMAAVTIIITAAKVLDAITDPLMGAIIDLTRTRWGKLRPYIAFSALPVAALTTALFAIPDIAEPGKIAFFGVCFVAWGLAYTACDVPFWGLIGSAFADPGYRTRVISDVRAFGAIALGLATLGMPLLARLCSAGPRTTGAGWTIAVGAVSAAGMALFLLAFAGTRERAGAAERRYTVRELAGALGANRPLLLVLLGSVLGFGRYIVQAGGAVFVVIAYDDEAAFTLIGAAIIAGMVLASFLTPRLLRRTDPRTLIVASSLIGAGLYVAMYLAGFTRIGVLLVFIFLTGMTLGVFLVVQTTMIADAVDDAERRTGMRTEGVSFSSLTFVTKIMNALAVLAFGAVVVAAGYEAGVRVTPAMQGLVFASLTLLPAASCALSAVPFAFYRVQPVRGAH